jgi:hypothetical protein
MKRMTGEKAAVSVSLTAALQQISSSSLPTSSEREINPYNQLALFAALLK